MVATQSMAQNWVNNINMTSASSAPPQSSNFFKFCKLALKSGLCEQHHNSHIRKFNLYSHSCLNHHHVSTWPGFESRTQTTLLALSNGQTRRARIVKAILDNPELLLLDQPLSKSYLFLSSKQEEKHSSSVFASWS